jgi:hypothetical protein
VSLGGIGSHLLKNETIPRTPAKDWIGAFDTIYGRLTSYTPPAFAIELEEFITYRVCFRIEPFLAPRKSIQLSGDMSPKYARYVVDYYGITPKSKCLRGRGMKCGTVAINFSKR